MKGKQVLGAIVLVFVISLLLYPVFSRGTLAIELRSNKIEKIDHLILEIHEIRVRTDDPTLGSRWNLVSNQSLRIDLASASGGTVLSKVPLPVGNYTGISLKLISAKANINGTDIDLTLSTQELSANTDFLVKMAQETSLNLRYDIEIQSVITSKLLVGNFTVESA